MLALALGLLLSQSPSALPSRGLQRFDAEREPVLEALAAKYACAKPRSKPEPLCEVALAQARGTAADIRGQNALVGLTWIVKQGKAGKVDVSPPRLSALALNKDSVGVWGAFNELTPQDAEEKKVLARLTKDYEAHFRGRKTSVTPPDAIRALLAIWSRSANHLVEKKDDAWVFTGAPGASRKADEHWVLRKVDEHWILMGMPKAAGGLVVSVFVP